MFALAVRFDLRPDVAEEFDRLTAETVARIVDQESGTIIYGTHRVEGEPDVRVFYEVYRNRAAFDDHERQPHTRRFLSEREQYLTGPPRVEFLSPTAASKGLSGGAA